MGICIYTKIRFEDIMSTNIAIRFLIGKILSNLICCRVCIYTYTYVYIKFSRTSCCTRINKFNLQCTIHTALTFENLENLENFSKVARC